MANITIDYANERFKENIYQNSFIEKFVFKNVPKDIIAFQFKVVLFLVLTVKTI